MEEARYSFNVKCKIMGFDSCFTLREDAPGKTTEFVERTIQLVAFLAAKGAVGCFPYAPKPAPAPAPAAPAPAPASETNWNSLDRGSAAPAPALLATAAGTRRNGFVDVPVCKVCGSSASMELISFEKDGKPREAYKCQACKKWAR